MAYTVSTLLDCVLPHDLMLLILTRLPAIPLFRFKTVSKAFNSLISSSWFITLHRLHRENNPQNDFLIIHSNGPGDYSNHLSLLDVSNATRTGLIPLLQPFPGDFVSVELVGSINGIVCLACTTSIRRIIFLWNPAINQWKTVRLSGNKLRNADLDSLGFAFDAENSDFKVVRAVFMRNGRAGRISRDYMLFAIEVYSSSKDSWKLINVDFNFYISHVSRANVIVNGEPFWYVGVYLHDADKVTSVMFNFDVKTERFKHFPLPTIAMANGKSLVACKNSLPYSVVSNVEDSSKIVEIWMFDEVELSWGNRFIVGSIGMKVERPLQCSKGGKILAEGPNGKLFLFDPKRDSSREVQGARMLFYQAFCYTESMIRLKGMEPVNKNDSVAKMVLRESNVDRDRTLDYGLRAGCSAPRHSGLW